jgi:hypothetical protein
VLETAPHTTPTDNANTNADIAALAGAALAGDDER